MVTEERTLQQVGSYAIKKTSESSFFLELID